jgi:hypothetical protein
MAELIVPLVACVLEYHVVYLSMYYLYLSRGLGSLTVLRHWSCLRLCYIYASLHIPEPTWLEYAPFRLPTFLPPELVLLEQVRQASGLLLVIAWQINAI